MPNNQFVLIGILYTMSFWLRRSRESTRRLMRIALAALPLTLFSPSPLPGQTRVDHAAFDSLLRAHVTDGLVDYDAFRDAPAFRRYLASLERASLVDADDEEQLAFWINVYNAYTIQLIVAHGERESIRNINRTLGVLRLKGPWSEPIVRAAGRTLTLDEVAHRIIRKDFPDPRIHFALVSAAKGSPPLRSEAYTGAALDRQLFDQGRRFLKDTVKNHIETARPTLSPIFTYYQRDFGVTRAELGTYLGTWFEGEIKTRLESGRFGMRETKFDWALNAKPVTRR